MTDTFVDEVTEDVRQVDREAWEEVYVVGDVHGCRPALERLLRTLGPNDDDLVVFVGDLVRKGPDSAGVVDLVRSRPNFLSVRGNNEEKLLRGEKQLPELTDEDLSYLDGLPVAITWEGTVVLHGGIDPHRPPADHTAEELQNIAELDGGFWWEAYAGPERVFFGHKPLADPVVGPYTVGLDTGCVYGNALTAYDCTADRLVSVAPDRTYHERAAHKWVHPGEAVPAGGLARAPTGVTAD
ncbi:MAG: metallophosphoesterase family protein [Salinirussus sp.]